MNSISWTKWRLVSIRHYVRLGFVFNNYVGAQNAEESLNQEKEKNADLTSHLERLRDHVSTLTSKFEGLQRKEKEMNERHREQVCINVTFSMTDSLHANRNVNYSW